MHTTDLTDARLAALAEAMWTERSLVEQLAFKLKALELVLGAELRRYVARCLDEVDVAADLLDAAGLRRQAALDELAAGWGRTPGTMSLDELAAAAPEPWASVFADQHDALRALVADVDTTAAVNGRLAAAALESVDVELAALERPEPPRYGVPAGPRPVARPRLWLVPAGEGVTA